MAQRSDILKALYSAVRSTNETLPAASRIDPSETEHILGKNAKIDSLGFVTLMVAVEQEIEALAGSCPSLVEEISNPDAGVTTLGGLADYIAQHV